LTLNASLHYLVKHKCLEIDLIKTIIHTSCSLSAMSL